MELSLSSLIRFQNYTFSTPSEKFHTIFATVIFTLQIAFLIFSLAFIQSEKPKLDSKEAKEKYGDLYLGLKTKERTALLSPVVFLLRRLFLAAIVVFWPDRSYFQIQTIIFKCSLVMIFTGYMEPLITRIANRMELINDAIVLMCSYFLIIFSSLVDDPETRYTSAWPLIGLILGLILFNLGVIMFRGIKSLIHHIKLRILRYKNRKFAEKKEFEKNLINAFNKRNLVMRQKALDLEQRYVCQNGLLDP